MKFKILFYLSMFGFVLSLAAHLVTFFGINPQNQFPSIWILHVGVFVVFVPAVNLLKKSYGNGSELLTKGMQYAPIWMKSMCVIFFIYAAINFTIFIGLMKNGSPEVFNGEYVLSNKGVIIEYIDENKYQQYQAYEVRGFTGHWMIFYFLPLTVFYSEMKRNSLIEENKDF